MITEQQKKNIEQQAKDLYPKNSYYYTIAIRGYIDAATLYQSKLNAQAELLKKAEDCLFVVSLLSEENGKPIDGFRFRENVLELRKLLSLIKQK